MAVMRGWRVIVVGLVLAGGCSKREAAPVESAGRAFAVGQVWTYHTRPGEEASRATIVTITPADDGAIMGVHLDQLAIKAPGYPDDLRRDIGHLPITPAALARSVVKLIETVADLPDYEQGFEPWKRGFDKGSLSVFEVTLAEIVAGTERQINEPVLPTPSQ